MARFKTTARLKSPKPKYPRMDPIPANRADETLAAKKYNYSLAANHWTLTDDFKVLIRAPGTTQWNEFHNWDPKFNYARSNAQVLEKRKMFFAHGVALDPTLYDAKHEHSEPSIAQAFEKSKKPADFKSK